MQGDLSVELEVKPLATFCPHQFNELNVKSCHPGAPIPSAFVPAQTCTHTQDTSPAQQSGGELEAKLSEYQVWVVPARLSLPQVSWPDGDCVVIALVLLGWIVDKNRMAKQHFRDQTMQSERLNSSLFFS